MAWDRLRGPLRVGGLAAVVLAAAAVGGADSQTVIAAAAVVVWWSVIVTLAVARLSRRPRASVPDAAIFAGGCLIGIGALSFLSLGWASDAGGAFAVAVQAALYAGVFVLVVLLSSPGDARSWLRGLALGLAAVCAVALVARLWAGVDADADLATALPTARGRLSFPIGYWNGLGALGAFALVLLTWLGAHGRLRLERALATAAIPLPCLVVYLSFSRGAIAAAAVGLVALVALAPARTRTAVTAAIGLVAGGVLVALAAMRADLRNDLPTSTADSQGVEVLVATVAALALVGILRYSLDAALARLRIPRIAAAAAVTVVTATLIVGVAVAGPGEMIEEFRDPPDQATTQQVGPDSRLASVTGHGRWQFWVAATNAFREEPLRGVGAGQFEAFWNQHGTLPLAIQHVHSVVLEHLAELGPLGLLLIVGALGAGLACGLGSRRRIVGGDAIAAGVVVLVGTLAFSIDWSWSIPGVALPVLVALAVVTGPATRPPATLADPARETPGGGSGIWLATATILLAWAAVWAGGVSLLTEIMVDRSQSAAARDDLVSAASSAEDAITLQPWAAEPRLQLGLVHELAGELPAARERLLEAADRAPEDWGVWFVLARVEQLLGNDEAAFIARGRASMLLPESRGQ